MRHRTLAIRLSVSWVVFAFLIGAIISGPSTSWRLKTALFLLYSGLRYDTHRFRYGGPTWLQCAILGFALMFIGLLFLMPSDLPQFSAIPYGSQVAGASGLVALMALSIYRDYLIVVGAITRGNVPQ